MKKEKPLMHIRRERKTKSFSYAKQIAKILKNITGVNVFQNTRKTEVVELRSLLVYILREVEDMTYYSIRDFFVQNGKEYDHSTALHAYRNYLMFEKYNPALRAYFNTVVNQSKTANSKKLVAKAIIDNNEVEVAELFTYMINK